MENPADGILLEGFSVQVDESSLTGESKPMNKASFSECMAKYDAWIRNNPGKVMSSHQLPSPVILAGTKVINGTGKMIIINVGKHSAIGSINEIIESGEAEMTPLQMKLELIARDISFFGLGSAVILFVVLIIRWIIENSINGGSGWNNKPAVDHVNYVLQAFLMGITVLVVAIPEGLPLAVMLTLAFSVSKMMEQNNLVKNLVSCETMGGANIICTDKTGTLTKNEMFLTNVWTGNTYTVYDSIKGTEIHFDTFIAEQARELFLNTIILNSLEDPSMKKGNPTEMAFLKYLQMCKVDIIGKRESFEKIFQATFSSNRKRMSTIIKMKDGKTIVFIKGASELIIESCDFFHDLHVNTVNQINFDLKKKLEQEVENLASKALRTIGIAYKELNLEQTDLENADERGAAEHCQMSESRYQC
jgi:Ca2+ transporting ATPase